MGNPFPGMNPYLENPQRWRSIHARLIARMDEILNQNLPPAFVSTIEERVYLALPSQDVYPDVLITGQAIERPMTNTSAVTRVAADAPFSFAFLDEVVHEKYLEIRVAGAEETVIAVVEVLSPTNKMREAYGRDAYVRKRDRILQTNTHLLEIDLLRAGIYTVAFPRAEIEKKAGQNWQYIACLYRAEVERRFDVWPVSLRSRLPRVSIPLTAEYPDVVLDLQACLDHVYDAGALERRIDYRQPPLPPLTPDDDSWANELLQKAGLRP